MSHHDAVSTPGCRTAATRQRPGRDAGHRAGHKQPVAAVKQSLGILPTPSVMVAATTTARFKFAPPEHGAAASGLKGWARTPGTLSQCSAGQHGDSCWRDSEASQLLCADTIVAWIEPHTITTCRIKSIYFLARGNARAYMVLAIAWHKPLCFALPERGTDPPSGVSYAVRSLSPSAGAQSAAIVWAGSAHAPLPHETQGNQAPHRVFLQFQQVSDRGEAGASCGSAAQPGWALSLMLLAESPNAQSEATSILL